VHFGNRLGGGYLHFFTLVSEGDTSETTNFGGQWNEAQVQRVEHANLSEPTAADSSGGGTANLLIQRVAYGHLELQTYFF